MDITIQIHSVQPKAWQVASLAKLARQQYHRDFNPEISQIHIAKIPQKEFSICFKIP